jgi:sugar phosphate permease
VGWATCSILCGLVQTPMQLIFVRFMLGVCEGGLWPAIMVILTHWFANDERAQANAYFTMSIAVASIITGPISGWIIDTFSWRWVFIVEGVLTLATIALWYPLISDRPEEATWIGAEEKETLTRKLRAEQTALKAGTAQISYRALLANPRLWQLVAVYFFFIVGIYGFAMWLPSILKSLTNTGMTSVGILSMFPYVAMIGGLYVFGRLSDGSGNRKLYMAIPIVLFGLSFFLSTVFKSQIWISYAFLVLAGAFTQSASCTFWAIPPLVFPAEVAGGARGIINALGTLGGLLGSYAVGWCVTYFGNFDAGIYFVVGALVICFVLILSLPSNLSGKAEAAGGVGGAFKHG